MLLCSVAVNEIFSIIQDLFEKNFPKCLSANVLAAL